MKTKKVFRYTQDSNLGTQIQSTNLLPNYNTENFFLPSPKPLVTWSTNLPISQSPTLNIQLSPNLQITWSTNLPISCYFFLTSLNLTWVLSQVRPRKEEKAYFVPWSALVKISFCLCFKDLANTKFGYDLRNPKSKSWLTIASFPLITPITGYLISNCDK